MRCLCIEDFNGNYEDSKRDSYFKQYNFNPGNTVIKTSLAEGLDYIDSNYNTFDTVVLDIDLDLGDHNTIVDKLRDIVPTSIVDDNQIIVSTDDLRRDAGFYVFLKLLHKGFPKERIAFLTGNGGKGIYACIDNLINLLRGSNLVNNFSGATNKTYITVYERQKDNILSYLREIADIDPSFTDELVTHITSHNFQDAIDELNKFRKQHTSGDSNTFGEWTERFTAAGIKSPIGFRKNQETKEFIQWKNSKENDYYKLRSAIILACREISELLSNKGDDIIKLHDFLYDDKSKKDKLSLYSASYLIDMLTMVESLLPLQVDNNTSNIYRQLIKTISHDWEACVPLYSTKTIEEVELGTYSFIMKLVRNWVSHNKLTKFTEESAAFIFIIAMRTFFKLPDEALDYETELLELITDKPIDYMALKNLFNFKESKELINNMNTSFAYILDNAYVKQVSVYELLKDIGGLKSDKKVDITLLYKMLWHGIFYERLEQGPYSVSIKNHFDISLVNKMNSILTLLCRHTYKKALI